MSIGKPKIVECPERRNNVSDRYIDERLSKFLTNDKRARWPRQEDGHGFKRR